MTNTGRGIAARLLMVFAGSIFALVAAELLVVTAMLASPPLFGNVDPVSAVLVIGAASLFGLVSAFLGFGVSTLSIFFRKLWPSPRAFLALLTLASLAHAVLLLVSFAAPGDDLVEEFWHYKRLTFGGGFVAGLVAIVVGTRLRPWDAR